MRWKEREKMEFCVEDNAAMLQPTMSKKIRKFTRHICFIFWSSAINSCWNVYVVMAKPAGRELHFENKPIDSDRRRMQFLVRNSFSSSYFFLVSVLFIIFASKKKRRSIIFWCLCLQCCLVGVVALRQRSTFSFSLHSMQLILLLLLRTFASDTEKFDSFTLNADFHDRKFLCVWIQYREQHGTSMQYSGIARASNCTRYGATFSFCHASFDHSTLIINTYPVIYGREIGSRMPISMAGNAHPTLNGRILMDAFLLRYIYHIFMQRPTDQAPGNRGRGWGVTCKREQTGCSWTVWPHLRYSYKSMAGNWLSHEYQKLRTRCSHVESCVRWCIHSTFHSQHRNRKLLLFVFANGVAASMVIARCIRLQWNNSP